MRIAVCEDNNIVAAFMEDYIASIPQIIHLLTEQGVSIFSVIPRKATLEEIFMS